jgi:hypothetical protein
MELPGGEDMTQDEAFAHANDVLKNAVGGIAEIINVPGHVNVDFEDVRTVMGEPGKAMMGTASASGPDRARIASEQAVACPLLEGIDLSGAKGVLVLISAAKGSLKLSESKQAMNTIRAYASESAHVIYGTAYDESLGDEIRVTVVATGLSSQGARRTAPPLQVLRTGTDNVPFTVDNGDAVSPTLGGQSPALGGDYGRLNTPSVWRTNRTQAAAKVDGMASAGMDDIEIPAFLRKQSDSLNQSVQSSTTSPGKINHANSMDPSLISQLVSKVKDWVAPSTPSQASVLNDEDLNEVVMPSEASREDIAMALNTAALHASSFRIALQHTLKLNIPASYAPAIIDLTKVTKDSATSWALLFECLFGDIEQSGLLDRHAKRLLRSQLKLATKEMQERSKELFERMLAIAS